MEVTAVEVEEEEGMMVVTNVSSMMNTMLGHIRLPGQEKGEEELDLMVVEKEEERSQYGGRREPGGSDILTGVFFSLLAFRSEWKDALCCKHIFSLTSLTGVMCCSLVF